MSDTNGDKVRVLRVIEYVGHREWIDHMIDARTVKGARRLPNGCFIREAIIGETPEILDVMNNTGDEENGK